MELEPLGDRVLLKIVEPEEKTASGFYLPQEAQEKTQHGVVVSLGEDLPELNAKLVVDTRVMYDKYAGTPLSINKDKYIIVQYSDIIAIVK